MAGPRKVRDSALLDALDAASRMEFAGRVWRVVRKDRDPIRGSAPGGRWDDGSFDVLYTSREADGAVAEAYFHLMRGQPVFPSRIEFCLFGLEVALGAALKLVDFAELEELGVRQETYGRMHYSRRADEFTLTQQIGEAAHFLGFDGLIVPNARWGCENVVVFTDRIPPGALRVAERREPVDWEDWRRRSGG